MIDGGLPDSREEWPAEVLDRLKEFTQGDVVPAPALAYWADPRHAVWDVTKDAGLEQPDVVLVEELIDRVIITSQTCDIGEEDAAIPVKPFVQVSPVYDASDRSDRNLLRRRRGPAYLLHLPELDGGFYVADFRLEMPVEKGWLSQQPVTKAFLDEDAQDEVGRRLTRLRERPAFGYPLREFVAMPLVEALKALRQSDRTQFERVVDHVSQVRALVDSRLHPTTVQLLIVGDERIPGDVAEWFHQWWDEVNPAAQVGGVTLQALRVVTWDEMSASEYRRSGEVNLSRWSPD